MAKRKPTPKQAASAATLDRWQKSITAALMCLDTSSTGFSVASAHAMLVRLQRSMELAERR